MVMRRSRFRMGDGPVQDDILAEEEVGTTDERTDAIPDSRPKRAERQSW